MDLRNGDEQSGDTLMKFADRDIRRTIAGKIRMASEYELVAGEALEELVQKM